MRIRHMLFIGVVAAVGLGATGCGIPVTDAQLDSERWDARLRAAGQPIAAPGPRMPSMSGA